MLDFLRGFTILVGVFFAGDGLHRLGIPVPGGVLGMLLFYAALLTGVVKLRWVERASGFLLRNMVLLFVPLTVGLMDMGSILSRQSLTIVASLLVSFLAVLITTGLLGQWLLPASDADPKPEALL